MDCNGVALERLAQCAMIGIQCNFMDGECVLLHFEIVSYSADIPECEDMHTVKRCKSTF